MAIHFVACDIRIFHLGMSGRGRPVGEEKGWNSGSEMKYTK